MILFLNQSFSAYTVDHDYIRELFALLCRSTYLGVHLDDLCLWHVWCFTKKLNWPAFNLSFTD
jgi:hypothetical protein